MSVPAVATTASDDLARVLPPGRVSLRLPVLLAVPGGTCQAWLEVNGQRGPEVTLRQGVVARVTDSAVLRARTTAVVRVVADGLVVATWSHVIGAR